MSKPIPDAYHLRSETLGTNQELPPLIHLPGRVLQKTRRALRATASSREPSCVPAHAFPMLEQGFTLLLCG